MRWKTSAIAKAVLELAVIPKISFSGPFSSGIGGAGTGGALGCVCSYTDCWIEDATGSVSNMSKSHVIGTHSWPSPAGLEQFRLYRNQWA
jgi:hypothetical protein